MIDPTPTEGILLIDKPRGMTSHDVVDRVRRVAATRRVGHAGTLDPLADGLLVVAIGPATRVMQFLTGLDKTYVGLARLGAISSTYDAEGAVTEQTRPVPARSEPVEMAMRHQLGSLLQLPPPYSAVKVAGRKLYEYARQGEVVPQKPRHVHVQLFEALDYDPPHLRFIARVGSGTYIRSMVHDLGLALECGAYLEALRRTQVGSFSIDQAIPLERLINEPALLGPNLLSLPEALAHLPRLTIHPEAEALVLHGGAFGTGDILECDGILSPGRNVLVLGRGGRALSIARSEVPRPAGAAEGDEIEFEKPVLGATPRRFLPVRVLARP